MYRRARNALLSLVRDFSMHTGVGSDLVFRKYSYMFSPQSLVTLTRCIEETKDVPGCYVEAGCAYGATTVFLNKFMHHAGISKRYIAIDTFSGFVEEQADHETEKFGKPNALAHFFSVNKKAWYDYKLACDGVKGVESVESDVMRFNFAAIAPIAFCLIDVDLYLPVKDILPKIYSCLAPGGIIVTDDCNPTHLWNGAYHAYMEFMQAQELEPQIENGVLGIVKKPEA
jgi:O-methyltransferase